MASTETRTGQVPLPVSDPSARAALTVRLPLIGGVRAKVFPVPFVFGTSGGSVSQVLRRMGDGIGRRPLGDGTYGCLLPELTEEAARAALDVVSSSPGAARAKAWKGRQRSGRDLDLPKNTETLAGWLVPGL